MADAYEILGVSKTASQDEIKNAYRSLAKQFHPDLNPGNKTAELKFKELATAYEAVGTPEAREKYDRGERQAEDEAAQRSQGARGPFYHQTQQDGGRYTYSFETDAGVEDLFANLFGRRERGRAGTADLDSPGEDQLYQLIVDFRDAALGAEREISLPTAKRLRVKIPPGVSTGTKLRFKGQGGPGIGKGPAGDAYVEISVRPQEGFKRVGEDIESELQVSFLEALLGAEVPVPTIDGSVMLKVPAGVSTGSRLRIRGKGIRSGDKPGDQIAIVKIVMPGKVDPALQEAVRRWGGKFDYDARNQQ